MLGLSPAADTDDHVRPTGWLSWLSFVDRVALGTVWIWAAVVKMSDPSVFVRAIRAYRLLPEVTVVPLGYGLPALELVMGIFFVIGFSVRVTAVVSTLRLVVFIATIASAWARGLQIACGCFGGGGFATSGTHYPQEIARDIGFLIMSAFLVWWPRSPFAVDNRLRAWHDALPDVRRHAIEWGGTAAVVLALIGLGFAFQLARFGTVDPNADQPVGTIGKYIIPWGNPTAQAKVTIVEDLQCPNCRLLEQVVGPTITREVDNGDVLVLYRFVAYLNDASTTRYSSRALNALACVQDEKGTDAFVHMHDTLYENQPPEGSAGLTDPQLVDYAVASGADRAAVTPCVNGFRFGSWVAASTDQASKAGFTGTPTVLVNGHQLDLSQDPVGAFQRAIDAAGRGP